MRLTTEQRAEITRNIKLLSNSLFLVTYNGEQLNEVDELVFESKLNGKPFEFGTAECGYKDNHINDLIGFEIDLTFEVDKIDLDWFKRLFLKELSYLREEYKELIQKHEQEQRDSGYLDNDFERLKEDNY